MSGFDLRGLLEVLVKRDVDFVIVGGVAVGAHGYIRGTEDADIVPDPARENLRRLRDALRELDARLPLADGRPFDPARDAARLERGENMTFVTRLGGLDIIQHPHGGASFASLEPHAIQTELLGLAVRVCSLAQLRQMKAASGRTQDQADLENLPDD